MLRQISKQMLVANLALLVLLAISFAAITLTDVTAEPATHAILALSTGMVLVSSSLIAAFLATGWEP